MFLDVADGAHPFGLNLLDTGLGWDRDRAVANTLAVFQREWGDRYWGPRMEDAFRFALMTLFDANVACAPQIRSHGRELAVHAAGSTSRPVGRAISARDSAAHVTDPSIRGWWEPTSTLLERRFQLEIVNPVLSKIHRFEGSHADAQHRRPAASTIDPAAWLREGAIVIVNTARGTVGENAAALIGSTLLNLVTLGVAEQARLDPEARRSISMFVDEFHTIPGADYEGILAELSKYGANLVLATQSLARLLAIGQRGGARIARDGLRQSRRLVRLQLQCRGRRVSGAELGGASTSRTWSSSASTSATCDSRLGRRAAADLLGSPGPTVRPPTGRWAPRSARFRQPFWSRRGTGGGGPPRLQSRA